MSLMMSEGQLQSAIKDLSSPSASVVKKQLFTHKITKLQHKIQEQQTTIAEKDQQLEVLQEKLKQQEI